MSAPKRSLESAALAGNELISTPIGDFELRHSYFDDDASRRLFDEMDYQRACQAYIWGQAGSCDIVSRAFAFWI